MAIVYTDSWEASRNDSYDSREFGTIATVVTTAGEVLTPINVPTATHATTGVPLPFVGQQSLQDPRYYVQSVSAPRFKGPRYAEVGISYRLGRGSGEQENEDPLSNPVRYRDRNGITSEATDADVNGKPLLNSAGDPFSGTVQTNISAIYTDAIRNETSYDRPQAISFTNKVNADVFTVAGSVIQPGEAYCLGIQPESEYTLQDTYVPVVYSFEFRERLTLQNGDRVTAFIHRLLDKGRRAWIYSDEIVDIYHKNDDGTEPSAASSDVLLNGAGIPLDEASHVSIAPNFDPPDRGWVEPANKAPNATRDVDPETMANFLLYEKHFTANFGALGLP